MADPTQVQSSATAFPQANYNFFTGGGGPPGNRQIEQAGAAIQSNQRIWTLSYSGYTPKYFFIIGLANRSEFGVGGLPPSTGRPTGAFTVTNGYVILPLPKGLEDRQTINYSEYDLGPFLGNLFNQIGVGAIQTAAQRALQANSLSEALKAFEDLAASTSATAQERAQARDIYASLAQAGSASALQNILGPTITQGLETIGGVAINQFHTILLRGPAYKEHVLTFFLNPRNAQESTNIRDIIKRLRAAAAPHLLGPGNAFWGFPQVASCQFVPQGSDAQQTYMYAFKPAVIQAVSARYDNGDTVAFYKQQGAPESIVLSIALKEIEYWTSEDYGGTPNG